jgi:hypothetical protein
MANSTEIRVFLSRYTTRRGAGGDRSGECGRLVAQPLSNFCLAIAGEGGNHAMRIWRTMS